MNDFNEVNDELDDELDEESGGCPFCGDKEDSCSHALAGFDLSDGGEFHIGLIGGPLESAWRIGDFFTTLADRVAERAMLGAPPVANLPVDYDFVQKMVNALTDQVVSIGVDHYEECCDLGCEVLSDGEFRRHACDCLEKMLEYVGFPVYRASFFLDGACCSSNCETWYCEDAKKAAGEVDKAVDELQMVIEPYLNQ